MSVCWFVRPSIKMTEGRIISWPNLFHHMWYMWKTRKTHHTSLRPENYPRTRPWKPASLPSQSSAFFLEMSEVAGSCVSPFSHPSVLKTHRWALLSSFFGFSCKSSGFLGIFFYFLFFCFFLFAGFRSNYFGHLGFPFNFQRSLIADFLWL